MHISELRDDLLLMYTQLRSGEIKPKDAIEANNTAGKAISTFKAQLMYHALRREAPYIAELEAQEAAPLKTLVAA